MKQGILMKTQTRRKFRRQTTQVPILYGGCDYEGYNRAVMINSCRDGMYFESGTPNRPQSNIFIKIYVDLPISIACEQYKAFRARVKWCCQLAGGEKQCYGTGVQYLVKSHLLYGTNILNADYLCDYCDQRITDRLIHRTESGLILCVGCLQHIETLPYNMVNAVERVLIGNVT
jgi:hypothetical protein